MTMREIAAEMKLGLRTIEKEWAMSRAWMRRELRRDSEDTEETESSAEPDTDSPVSPSAATEPETT